MGAMHPFAVKRSEFELRTRDPSVVPLITYQYSGWIGQISIGTPPQTLQGKSTCIIRLCVYPDLCHSPIRHWFSVGTLFYFKTVFVQVDVVIRGLWKGAFLDIPHLVSTAGIPIYPKLS
jgi:hypothetical protein